MPKALEFTIGTAFGRLRTLGPTYYDAAKKARVVDVVCDCSTELTVRVGHVVRGHVQSCGCLKREQSREWCKRLDNPLRRRGKDSVRYKLGARQDKAEWLLQEKSRPCVDCGCMHHFSVMQFDHVPGRGNKRFEINARSVNRNGLTTADLVEERAKCDLVCANCHAYRTWARHHTEETCLTRTSMRLAGTLAVTPAASTRRSSPRAAPGIGPTSTPAEQRRHHEIR